MTASIERLSAAPPLGQADIDREMAELRRADAAAAGNAAPAAFHPSRDYAPTVRRPARQGHCAGTP